MVIQVISFHPDGSVSGLQHKPGVGIDLRSFGRAKIVRASEIVWNEMEQGWSIRIVDAPGLEFLKNQDVTFNWLIAAGDRAVDTFRALYKAGNVISGSPHEDEGNHPVIVRDYDQAVMLEVAFLDGLRVKGTY